MEKTFILFLICFTNPLLSQTGINSKSTSAVFDAQSQIKNILNGDYIDSLQKIKWKPYTKEQISSSLDGFAYTAIDSVILFEKDNKQFLLVVLRTIEIDLESGMDNGLFAPKTLGLALFIEEKNSWKLINLNRTVARTNCVMDLMPVKLFQISKSDFALSLKFWFTAGGGLIAPEYESWFNLSEYEFGQNIFTFYLANSLDNEKVIEKTIEIKKSADEEFFDFIINTTITSFSNGNQKIKKLPNERYYFDMLRGVYLLKNK